MRSTNLLSWLAALVVSVPSLAYAAGAADAADAAQRKDLPALRTLVSKKVNVNAPQADGTTALHWAAHYNLSLIHI